MWNHFFLLTVLAVTFWTGRGDQGPLDGINKGGDFYLEDSDMAEDGSGGYGDSWDSSFSSYEDEYGDPGSGDDIYEIETLHGSIHLNKNFLPAYYDRDSLEFQKLAQNFTLAMTETFENSPLKHHYISTRVLGFSPGSVQVHYELEIEPPPSLGGNKSLLEVSIISVVEDGVMSGKFEGLSPNASSLVVKAVENPMMMTTESSDRSQDGKTTEDGDKKDEKYRPDGEVEKEPKDIFGMILGDPYIIAAIVGGLIVILLSVILLFLFVVYRLKKKDEGSYSLDEPAKAKDPTAYWKETKEFYA